MGILHFHNMVEKLVQLIEEKYLRKYGVSGGFWIDDETGDKKIEFLW